MVACAPAVLVTAALFAWMVQRSAAGVNTAGLQMPRMDLPHRVAYWWPFLMGEALGISALVWSYLSVVAGLVAFTRSGRLGIGRARWNAFHRHVSVTTLLLIAGHVLFVAVGSMNGAMTVRTVNISAALLPFQTSWNGLYYDTGVFAFYLAILLGPTYYLRRRIGVRGWRIVHRASLAVYVLAVWHSFGFDDFDFHGPYRLALWIAQIPLAVLLLWRLVAPVGSGRRPWRPGTPRGIATLVVAGAVGVLVAIVASGHTGGGASPFHPDGAGTSAAPMSMSLLPGWLTVVWVAALCAVWLMHLRHAWSMPGPTRWWHAGHMTMAAGMIVMYLVPQAGHGGLYRAGVVVFATLSLTAASLAAWSRRRGAGTGWLWGASAVDMLVMAYMSLPTAHQVSAVSYLLVAYMCAELLVWSIGSRVHVVWAGRAPALVAGGGADDSAGDDGAGGDGAGGDSGVNGAAPADATAGVGSAGSGAMVATVARRHTDHRPAGRLNLARLSWGVRVTLAVMSASMAWMLIAMLAMAAAAPGMPAMPMP